MKRTDWESFRASEFKSIDTNRTIAVFPTAAIEQHGPHLPVGTDNMIARGMIEEVKRILPDDLDVRILPIQSVGKSNEHLWAVGTLSLTANTALNAWTEIGLSVARSGIKKIVIVNSHGGNLDLVSILARELRVQAGMFAVKCQWTSFGHPEGLFSEREDRIGIHGGDFETSMMLHLHPNYVDMSKAQDFPSTAETDNISPIGPISYGWIARDICVDGVAGNASAATREKGKSVMEHQAKGFVELLYKVKLMPLHRFSPATEPNKSE